MLDAGGADPSWKALDPFLSHDSNVSVTACAKGVGWEVQGSVRLCRAVAKGPWWPRAAGQVENITAVSLVVFCLNPALCFLLLLG